MRRKLIRTDEGMALTLTEEEELAAIGVFEPGAKVVIEIEDGDLPRITIRRYLSPEEVLAEVIKLYDSEGERLVDGEQGQQPDH